MLCHEINWIFTKKGNGKLREGEKLLQGDEQRLADTDPSTSGHCQSWAGRQWRLSDRQTQPPGSVSQHLVPGTQVKSLATLGTRCGVMLFSVHRVTPRALKVR